MNGVSFENSPVDEFGELAVFELHKAAYLAGSKRLLEATGSNFSVECKILRPCFGNCSAVGLTQYAALLRQMT